MQRRARRVLLVSLLTSPWLLAAGAPIAPQSAAPSAVSAPFVVRSEVGRSVNGRPIECVRLGEGSQRVLIIASIHGNEVAGTPLVEALERELLRRPALLHGRRIAIVPVANPDGVASRRRHNANGVDLNRNFPAENFDNSGRHGREALSEPESRALHDLVLEFRPHRIVSIHQPIGCIDYDGPVEARALARAISVTSSMPLRKLGGRPGSFGSWAGADNGVPTVTLELPASATRMDETELWSTYGDTLLTAVLFNDGKDRWAASGGPSGAGTAE